MVSTGQEVRFAKLGPKVLYPIKGETYEDANSESMVLWLKVNGFDALFMGDFLGVGAKGKYQRKLRVSKRDLWQDGRVV